MLLYRPHIITVQDNLAFYSLPNRHTQTHWIFTCASVTTDTSATAYNRRRIRNKKSFHGFDKEKEGMLKLSQLYRIKFH
eukprot:scaffold66270_cov19-Prasinocladus_malaysianus.AAC.1